MQSAVAALLLAEAALSGSLVAAQPENERRTCLQPEGESPVKQHPEASEVVRTAEQLQLAVSRGTRFVYIAEHLDLRTLPVATIQPNCGVLQATTTSVIQVGNGPSHHDPESLNVETLLYSRVNSPDWSTSSATYGRWMGLARSPQRVRSKLGRHSSESDLMDVAGACHAVSEAHLVHLILSLQLLGCLAQNQGARQQAWLLTRKHTT